MITAGVSTRTRLLRAAREIIDEQGYAGASVNAVAERAGVAAGTLYRHFASKEEMFVELFRAVADGELEAMRDAAAAMPTDSPAVDVLVAMLITFARRALHAPRLAWALLAEPVDPLVDAERLVYRARHADLLTATLERAIAAGEIPEQAVRLTAVALVGGCAEVLVGPLSPVDAPPSNETELLESLRLWLRRSVGSS